MTNEINPNRGGPNCGDIDTQSLRFPVRGRSDTDSSGTYRDRLQAQIEKPGVEVSYCPEINTEAVIEPSDKLIEGCNKTYSDRHLLDEGEKMTIEEFNDQWRQKFNHSQELGRAWLKGLEFGEGHRD